MFHVSLQGAALPHGLPQSGVEGPAQHQDLDLEYRVLSWRQRSLGIDVLARELGVGPHVARLPSEAGDHPPAIGREGGDERLTTAREAL